MLSVLAAGSVVLQLALFFGLGGAMLEMVKFWQVTTLYGPPDDPRLVAGVLAQILTGLIFPLSCGIFGLVLAWFLLRKRDDSLRWFRRFSRVLAWVWLILFPIGTMIGLMLFVWLRRSTNGEAIASAA